MPRLLHVANGTSTTNTITAAGIPGVTSIWADPLHDGPVPAGLDDEALVELRARHLAPQAAATDPVNDLRAWRRTIDRHGSYDELILWFEHDLFDQLNLIQLLTWIRQRLPVGKTVSLICIGSFPDHPNFRGLGELTPDELASLFEARQRVSEAQYAVAKRAWHAFRHSSPEALNDVLETDMSALPYLAPALRRFLEEYPSTLDGLSRTERTLLHLAATGSIEQRIAFLRMHETENAYYITDTSFEDLVRTLASASPPLLDAANGVLSLTAAGRAILDGRSDRVATCGIDRWLGGVHLQGQAIDWRWNRDMNRIVMS